jgi:hypothetical protein
MPEGVTRARWLPLLAVAAAGCTTAALFGDGEDGDVVAAAASASSSGGNLGATSSGAATEATSAASADASSGAGASGGDGGSRPMKLDCGSATCAVGGDSACCWDRHEEYDPPQAECVDAPPESDDCAANGDGFETRIECQGTEHCASGQVCCGVRATYVDGVETRTIYTQTTCEASCGLPDIQLCMPGDVCPVLEGGIQSECQESELLPPGYGVCYYP